MNVISTSVFADFAEELSRVVNLPNPQVSQTYVAELIASTIRPLDDGYLNTYLQTKDYEWDRGLPTIKELKAKGPLLDNYILTRLIPYLHYLIVLFRAEHLLLINKDLRLYSVDAHDPTSGAFIHVPKELFVITMLRVMNFEKACSLTPQTFKEMLNYIANIVTVMTQESPDYNYAAVLYDNAETKAVGFTSIDSINFSDIKVTDPTLKKVVETEAGKIEVTESSILKALLNIETFVKSHPKVAAAGTSSIVALIILAGLLFAGL